MKALLIACFAALVLAPSALAHASLVRTAPANGAVLARPPAAVRVVFDDTVARGPGIEAVRNGGGSILAGEPRVEGGRTLVLPLRRGLADGAYSVRWAIVSDDGHLESGVLAFAVGVGRPPPTAVLGAEATGLRPADVAARWFFLAGVLASVGIALFALLGRVREEWVALLLASSAVVAALGAADESHRVGLHTRAGTVFVAGAAYAVVVALVAAAALLERRARTAALWLALPLVAVPGLSGHALDHGLSRVNLVADILHVAGAAAWVGALLGVVVTRRRDVRLAAAGVVLLAATGVVRASYELLHVAQLWGTGYGRALLVKTGLLLAAVALGARRRARSELVVVAAIVVAVSVLVLERPGRNVPPPARAAVPSTPQPPPPRPPADAIVVARELGPYGVALQSERTRLTAIVLSPAGGGASGLHVSIDGKPAAPCGHGCYRVDGPHGDTARVTVDGLARSIPTPRNATPTSVAFFRSWFRTSQTVRYVERLASGPAQAIVTRWTLQRPNRFAYAIRDGAQAIVVGGRRWDRAGGGAPWVESAQTPLPQPVPPFTTATNVWQISAHEIVFVDPTIPAYFEVEFHERPTELHMVAAAHFMTDRYLSFGSAPPIRPPR